MRRQTPTDRVADEDIGIEEFDGGNEHEGAEHVLEGNYAAWDTCSTHSELTRRIQLFLWTISTRRGRDRRRRQGAEVHHDDDIFRHANDDNNVDTTS